MMSSDELGYAREVGVGSSCVEFLAKEEDRCLNSELWHACAGPLVSLPTSGTQVVYFPQGHCEQVAASTNKEIDYQIPNYPSLTSQVICQLHNVIMHADLETDEVYAQMTLQPLSPEEQKDPYLPAELGTPNKQPNNYFCKTLTASDTSTHGGFSVPRRAAEKVFPRLDFSKQPPAQELIARDLHGNEWKFRHVFRGQPKRHLLTTGWSIFVSAKKLIAGDSVLFIWNEDNQLLLGIRHANRPQNVMPSSVLSSNSMHIGLLSAAAHTVSTNSRFIIFYNPRASPSEFVIPLAKYVKTVYHTRVSVGMHFRMLFETEESSVRRYMGTITGIGDLDSARWPNSHWRSVKVGWDESTAGDKQTRVSLWDIEPLTTFPMYPSTFPLRLKRPWPIGLPSLQDTQSLNFQGIDVMPWLQPGLDSSFLGMQSDFYRTMDTVALHEMRTADSLKQASPATLQLLLPQNIVTRSSSISSSQFSQHVQSQSPQSFLPFLKENQMQNQTQAQYLQNHLQIQQGSSFAEQQEPYHSAKRPQQELQQVPQQHQQLQSPHRQQFLPQKLLYCDRQTSNAVSALSQLPSGSQSPSTTLNSVSSLPQLQNFPDSNYGSFSTSVDSPMHGILCQFFSEETLNLLSFRRTFSLIDLSSRPSNRVAIESLLPSRAQCILPEVEQSIATQPNISQQSVSLTPFPCTIDPRNRHLCDINIDSSSPLLNNGLSSFNHLGNRNSSTIMSYATSDFLSDSGNDLGFNQACSDGLEESEPFQSLENMDQLNSQSGIFVKICKSGSFGRSLDISKFSSYHELRSELGHLFGLEGQVEDPLRSGWQLVFIDKENDVLLVGDDPWHEFVNSVSCIKILSPQEVQLMGRKGVEFFNSNPTKKLKSNNYDEYISQQD